MSDSWDERRRAKEEEFFDRQNREALDRLKARSGSGKPRLSPITGEAMEQITVYGVAVDRCPTSGGIWLDAGELELVVKAANVHKDTGGDWVTSFFSGLFGKK